HPRILLPPLLASAAIFSSIVLPSRRSRFPFFSLHTTAPTEIYPLSLHDALPISEHRGPPRSARAERASANHPYSPSVIIRQQIIDRKSTRLNSSHGSISYAVFCLKKKK